MVPLTLAVKNFLSYGQTTQYIDFKPYNLICLSGKNGHGKSALLDALTWVVWGAARKAQSGPRADEHLVRLGQTQMMVSLECMSNNVRYKIRRELTISSGKVQTTLDFGIIDAQTGAIKSLTDKTVRTTQEKIIAAIGLDYESFINSVFLRQGASNEFSKKAPKERKEILCSMLGITHFERIKKKAVEKSRLMSTQRDTLMPIHQRLACQITHKERLVADLAHARQQEQRLQSDQQLINATLHDLELRFQQQTQDLCALQELTVSCEKLRTRRAAGVEELRNAYGDFKKILVQKIHASGVDHTTHERLEKELEAVHAAELRRSFLQQESLRIAHLLQQRASILISAHTQKTHALEMQLQQATLASSMERTRATELSEKIALLEQEILQKKSILATPPARPVCSAVYERYRELYQKFVTHKNNLLTKVQDYEYTITKLSTQTVAYCPTCTQELTAEKKITLCTLQHTQRARAHHQLKRFARLLPAFKQTIITVHAALETLKEIALLEKQLPALRDQLDQIRARLATHAQLIEGLVRETQARAQQEPLLLMHDAEYQEYARQAHHVEEQLRTLVDVPPDYKRTLTDRVKASTRAQSVSPQTTQVLVQQIKKVVHVTVAHLKIMKAEERQQTMKIQALAEKIAAHAGLESAVQAARQAAQEQTNALHTLVRQIGSYKEQLTALEVQTREFEQLSESIKRCSYEHELYQNIAHAVGKDGIQALLIEQALPEIEQEANALLEKLTDGQAHIVIESLRDLKSGKSKETLDIHISDATGIRAYELFSGGEAFRIDFALRIALSKLLARRAGTTLQTLIIDEGFGSQDEEGLSHIMEAIYKIQDDFAKIIIVSHLPYMKEHFPVHFVVNKTAQGSSIKVIQQG